MLAILYQTAISEGADITVSDIFYELPTQTIVAVDSVAATQADNLRQAIEQKIVYTGLWNKLILSELIKQPECRFAEGLNMSEDRLVGIKLYYFASLQSYEYAIHYLPQDRVSLLSVYSFLAAARRISDKTQYV